MKEWLKNPKGIVLFIVIFILLYAVSSLLVMQPWLDLAQYSMSSIADNTQVFMDVSGLTELLQP